MALPGTGLITAAMINIELKRAQTAAFSLDDPAVRALAGRLSGAISFSDFYGKSSEILVTLAAGQGGHVQSYFTAADWTSDTEKRVLVPAGVEVPYLWLSTGSGSTPWGGKVTVQVDGILSGWGGGTANGWGNQGTPGFYSNMGTPATLALINNGIIRSGGGRGGTGGNGGSGSYAVTVREPASGWNWHNNSIMWFTYSSGRLAINWGGQVLPSTSVSNYASLTSYQVGSYTYLRGPYKQQSSNSMTGLVETLYQIARQYSSTSYSSGGGGGAGGAGQGYGSAAQAGANGAAGGTNAGTGGKGGTGGSWGQAGNTGASGGAGNAGAGGGGAAGAALVQAIHGVNRMTYSGSGSAVGGTANT